MDKDKIEELRRELSVWCEKYVNEFKRKIPKRQRIEYMEHKINALVTPVDFWNDLNKEAAKCQC